MVCNLHSRWPVAVIEIREIPSRILKIVTFPACIGYQTIAKWAKYSKHTTLVYPVHGNNSGISWHNVICWWSPVIVFPKTHTISEHLHRTVTSKACGNICNAKTISSFDFLLSKNCHKEPDDQQLQALSTTLHTAGAREIWIDQSGFNRREKLYRPCVNVSWEERHWNQATSLIGDCIKNSQKEICDFQNHITLQKVENMKHIVFQTF